MKNVKPLKECRVLCTPASFGKKDGSLMSTLEGAVGEVIYNPFGRPLKAAELRPLITEADGYIAGIDEADASVIRSAARLRVIACYGVGYDRVDIAEATARGIIVTNSPGANSAAVAELTIAFILSLARNLVLANEAVKRGGWPLLDGVGIRDKTVGIIGLGAIGREVARRLKGFDCRLIAYDPYLSPDIAQGLGVCVLSRDEVLAQSDFVSLHVPATKSTTLMVNREFLERMKEGAFLINTARGDLIDEGALLHALRFGRLKGFAADCFSKEPPDRDNPLLGLPEVLVTPHTGSHTDEALNRMGFTALENCLAVLRGESPPNIVNPEVLEECRRKDSGR